MCSFISRDNAKKLLYENDSLQQQMSQTERDTIEVISFLKQEDMKKDDQVSIYLYIIKLIGKQLGNDGITLTKWIQCWVTYNVDIFHVPWEKGSVYQLMSKCIQCISLFLTECEVHTVSYGPIFCPSTCTGHKKVKKNRDP